MNIKNVLNGIAQDLCIISSSSDFLNYVSNKSRLMIEKSLQIALTTINAASEFYHGLNILRNKVFDQNLEILELRRTLIDLQKRFEVFNSFFNKLRNNICYKAVNYVIKILFKLIKIFNSILRNIIQSIFSFSKKITALRLINMVKENEILLSIVFSSLKDSVSKIYHLIQKNFINN